MIRLNCSEDNTTLFDEFLNSLTPMQAGKAEKTLLKPINFSTVGARNEKELVEYAVKNNMKIEVEEGVKSAAIKARQYPPNRVDFLQKEEHIRNADLGDIVRRGTVYNGLWDYLQTGNTTNLPSKYKTTEYQFYLSDGSYYVVSKTAYNYYQFIMS